MNLERLILIAFMGNYLINNIVGALAALAPVTVITGFLTVQYLVYIILAMIMVKVLTWWYMRGMRSMNALMEGLYFGVGGFLVALVTAFVFGLAGALARTGSLSQMVAAVSGFGPFIMDKSTLILLVIWVLPALAVGWWLQMKSEKRVVVTTTTV
jgi:hypothetical protein